MQTLILTDVKEGKWSLLFVTPEALKTKKWRDVVRKFASSISYIALDECHCIVDW